MQEINGKCNSVKQSLIVYESFTTNLHKRYCINKYFCNNQYLFDCQTVFVLRKIREEKGKCFAETNNLRPNGIDKKWDLFQKVNSHISFTQAITMNRKIPGTRCNLRVLHSNRLVKYVFMNCYHELLNFLSEINTGYSLNPQVTRHGYSM